MRLYPSTCHQGLDCFQGQIPNHLYNLFITSWLYNYGNFERIQTMDDVMVTRLMFLPHNFVQCRETCALWVSFDVPVTQPPGVYIGEIWITAVRGETE